MAHKYRSVQTSLSARIIPTESAYRKGLITEIKAGAISITETLKVELARDNIGGTVICPTVFATSLGDSIDSERAMERTLLKQLEISKVTPAHIADDVIAIKNGYFQMKREQTNSSFMVKV